MVWCFSAGEGKKHQSTMLNKTDHNSVFGMVNSSKSAMTSIKCPMGQYEFHGILALLQISPDNPE